MHLNFEFYKGHNISNRIVNNENRFNENKSIQNTETSINKNIKVNSFFQRIANGESGVVLDALL
ncbi:hypothetical protein CA158_14575 [Vibrio parahaemolyticus]|nr:hypothetical protein [Vibrio parahaemolyticus]EGQ9621531.1 hypothetical protein [Vibrio parahaemolyticus]EGR0986586.1 hypothetical protein [Vibrio parahaemolyticus]EGR1189249.1 hypothetical protein [Vibrio parahaemolyticus]EGR1192801.1 hypothetical protein [Vibrio parahaemolyticus]